MNFGVKKFNPKISDVYRQQSFTMFLMLGFSCKNKMHPKYIKISNKTKLTRLKDEKFHLEQLTLYIIMGRISLKPIELQI